MEILKYTSLALLISATAACEKPDTTAPRVVSTFPTNMSDSVDHTLNTISVTFNEQMMDQSWSWAYTEKTSFPQITGQAYYDNSRLKNTLPVKLEPDKTYEIWINSNTHQNFKDASGNPSVPFRFTFKTSSQK